MGIAISMVAASFTTTSSTIHTALLTDVLEDAGPLLVQADSVAQREVEVPLDLGAGDAVQHLALLHDLVPQDRARGPQIDQMDVGSLQTPNCRK